MTYADWKAPRDDGSTLVWPAQASLAEAARANGRLLSKASTPVQNTPLGTLRVAARAFVGHPDDKPLFMTGHQAELWHPGVWMKNVLIHHLAVGSGGSAMHLAVDSDQPKHLLLRWPGMSMPISDADSLHFARWASMIDPPSPAHLNQIGQSLAKSGPGDSMLPAFLDAMRHITLDEATNSDLCKAIAVACHRIDWELGLRYAVQTLSPTLMSTPWLAMAHHVLSRARRFASDYNLSLAEYRNGAGIRSTSRPMPDLVTTPNGVELPFWTDDLTKAERYRTTVETRNGQWFLHAPYSDECLPLDDSLDADQAAIRLRNFLQQHRLRLAPRALSLTMFLRLFVADLFVHGIGGGRYDQITDRLIGRHFGIAPPAFAVTTATLYLPAASGRERTCVSCVKREGHRLKHDVLGARKREYVDAIAAAPRRSSLRMELFQSMQKEMRSSRPVDTAISQWKARLRETIDRAAEDQVMFDRELFYALQPADRLSQLIDSVGDQV
jgi:hypothetical protein